jgi:hypothetical protein
MIESAARSSYALPFFLTGYLDLSFYLIAVPTLTVFPRSFAKRLFYASLAAAAYFASASALAFALFSAKLIPGFFFGRRTLISLKPTFGLSDLERTWALKLKG